MAAQESSLVGTRIGHVQWVALDTNVYGQGSIRLKRLAEFAVKLQTLDITVLIHTFVLWEWAEHAHASYTAARNAMRDFQGDLDGARIDAFAEYELPKKTVSEILDHLRAQIAELDNVVVVPSTESGMRAGIRAQILLEPPGKRKGGNSSRSGTKTGAADMAAVHDVVDYVMKKNGPSGLAIISADKDIDAALASLGVDWAKRFADTGSALESFEGLEMMDLQGDDLALMIDAFTRYVVMRLPDDSEVAQRAGELHGVVDLIADESPALEGRSVRGVSVTEVLGVVRIENVRASNAAAADSARRVTANLSLVVEVAGAVEVANSGSIDLGLWHRDGMVLEVAVEASVTNDAHVLEMRAVAPGALLEPPRDPWRLEESRAQLVTALGNAPIFGDESWWEEVFTDSVPDDVPSGFDWLRNDFLDTDERYEITLVIGDLELPVSINEDAYELAHHGGGSFAITADATVPGGIVRMLEGAPAVTAELVRRWYLRK
ncbi:hypothetical protein [Promicromonospora sp. NPDC050880]|uniref:hypothetical protein n=1 Tax=Promicromonospora sp. NPDC050880 TaxID=3364406 RepID=UPI0037A74C51